MNATMNSLPAPAMNTKPLWAAVGVLGVAVVALGASLVYVQTRPLDGHTALAALSTPAPLEVAAAGSRVAPTESLDPREDLVAPAARPATTAPRQTVAKPVTRPVAVADPAPVPAVTPPTVAVVPAPVPVPAPSPTPVVVAQEVGNYPPMAPSVITDSGLRSSQPVQMAPRVLCANCGTIEAVTPIQRNAASGTGVGAIAGGALGAVVGNQIGKGSGRALATVLGAVGGGFAGNSIEKNMKKETVYQVQVRMEDGNLRTLEQASPATIGERVTVDGNRLLAPGQQSSAPTQTQPAPRPMVVSAFPNEVNR